MDFLYIIIYVYIYLYIFIYIYIFFYIKNFLLGIFIVTFINIRYIPKSGNFLGENSPMKWQFLATRNLSFFAISEICPDSSGRLWRCDREQ